LITCDARRVRAGSERAAERGIRKPGMAARCPAQTALAGCEGMSVRHPRTGMTFAKGKPLLVARP